MVVTKSDVIRHYLASVLIYGIVLLLLFVMPVFNQNIPNPRFSYLTILAVYYIFYVIFALPVYLKFKPDYLLNSRSIVIVKYFKRLLVKTSLEDKLAQISPNNSEKQAFIILFIKAFFGSYTLSSLCNKFLPQVSYNFDFLSTIWRQSVYYIHSSGIIGAIIQFIDDSTDVWLNLIFTVINLVFSISYLTELDLFKNKIKYADTSILGIISCLMCYYPFILLTEKIIPIAMSDLIPVENDVLRLILYILVLIINLVMLISVIRLGTKTGNLTNRGIVKGFPYNIVRHPQYSMQMLYIIFTVLAVCITEDMNFVQYALVIFGMFMWLGVYVLRSITEERNLINDENYKQYVNQVKYRFLPFII